MREWRDSLKSWKPWENETLSDLGYSIVNYGYKTVDYLFNQISVIPKVFHSVVQKPPIRALAGHLMRITIEDLAPLVYFAIVQEALTEEKKALLEENPNAAYLSVATLLLMSIYALEGFILGLSVRIKIQLFIRTMMATLEAPVLINQVKDHPVMTVCVEERCSGLRFVKGSMRDLTGYGVVELVIYLITYFLPRVGTILSISHQGQYILAIALPGVCHRHQLTYLREHPELALSLGLGHAGWSLLVPYGIEKYTGIPNVYYERAIGQFLLIFQMMVATHMILPTAPKKSTRVLRDPLLILSTFVGFIFDIFVSGFKIQIPCMLNNEEPGKAIQYVKEFPFSLWYHRMKPFYNNRVSNLFLPPLLQNFHDLIHDPICRYHWPEIQNFLVQLLKDIELTSKSITIRAAATMPMVVTEAALYCGIPTYITRLLLQLINNPVVITNIRNVRYQLEKLSLDPQMPHVLGEIQSIFPMRAPLAEIQQVSMENLEDDKSKEQILLLIPSPKFTTKSQGVPSGC